MSFTPTVRCTPTREFIRNTNGLNLSAPGFNRNLLSSFCALHSPLLAQCRHKSRENCVTGKCRAEGQWYQAYFQPKWLIRSPQKILASPDPPISAPTRVTGAIIPFGVRVGHQYSRTGSLNYHEGDYFSPLKIFWTQSQIGFTLPLSQAARYKIHEANTEGGIGSPWIADSYRSLGLGLKYIFCVKLHRRIPNYRPGADCVVDKLGNQQLCRSHFPRYQPFPTGRWKQGCNVPTSTGVALWANGYAISEDFWLGPTDVRVL